MRPQLSDARVLVTGAAGFIGRHVCTALEQQGARVGAIIRQGLGEALAQLNTYTLDVRDGDAVRAVVRKFRPTHVVHLAARKLGGTQLDNFLPSYQENLFGTFNLAAAVIDDCEKCRFVYLSSAEEYGRAPAPFDPHAELLPLTPYGLSKHAATQLLRALSRTHGLSVTILRTTSVYGPGQRGRMFVPSLLRSLVSGTEFPMTDGRQTRDFVYVDDIVDGILRALSVPEAHGDVLHLSSGTPVPIRELALLVARLVGGQSESLLKFGAVPYGVGEAMDYWASNSETTAVLGWTPKVSIDEGLRRTLVHVRSSLQGD